MAEERVHRRLAAILAADVVGYSRLIEADEEGTRRRMRALQDELIAPRVAADGGRIVKTTGDGILVEFASAVDALRNALAVQSAMAERNQALPEERRLVFRIGINLGDVIVEDDDIHGEGVNVAARLEALCEPGAVYISSAVHDQVAGKLAAAFDDLGEHRVKNISKPVRAFRARPQSAEPAPAETPRSASIPVRDRPSIAVLPFDNMSPDADQEFFVDGLVEDIITTLSKLSGLMVIARNSCFAYKGRSVDIRTVAAELGVRYVLEGSVRKAGNRIRITAQLIDAGSGAHLWGERYDRSLDDVFAVQDEMTLILATEMQVKLTEGDQARLRYATTENVAAWSKWVEGLSYFRNAITKDNCTRARDCWERALALDPTSASLHGMLAFIRYVDARFDWWDDRETALAKGFESAQEALRLDPENGDAHMSISLLHLVRGQFDEAVSHARRSVELAPGSADAATFACFVLASSGFPGEAVPQIEKAMTLSPNYPANYLGHMGNAYRLSGRFEEAITAFQAFDARNPGFGLTDLTIAYHQTDRADLARETAEKLLAARPEFTIEKWVQTQFRSDTAQLDLDIAALRAAGLPMA
jgi:adenylate cyclase